jgi:hypothetical protein
MLTTGHDRPRLKLPIQAEMGKLDTFIMKTAAMQRTVVAGREDRKSSEYHEAADTSLPKPVFMAYLIRRLATIPSPYCSPARAIILVKRFRFT